MYNPLTDKKPYGATAVGKETSIVFPLCADLGIKRVFVVLRHIFGEDGEIENRNVLRYELSYAERRGNEDIFKGAFALNEYGVWHYRFEGELENGDIAFFGRGIDGVAVRGDWLPEWQLTVSKIDYKTPDWAKHGVIYQIFADRFCKDGDNVFLKNGRLHGDWYETPDIQEEGKDYRADDFFGGNIKGIVKKLEYLKELGVSCIYLSPIFKSSSNHRYDTGDYLCIDELFGSEEEFCDLIERAKKLGIYVMLDGVFNHTGADSVYFDKFGSYGGNGAYKNQASPYRDWFFFGDSDDEYHCWWGSTVVPTVNKSAEGYRQLVLGDGGVIDKWTKLGVKGWRLDVVDELPIDFTDALCKKIKSESEDVLIVGEVWEDASTKIAYDEWRPYFMGEQLDSVMNYPFKEAIIDFAVNNDRQTFVQSVTHLLENYPKQSLDVLMNLVDSHDTVRALTRLSNVTAPFEKKDRATYRLSKDKYDEAKQRLKFAAFLQYTLPGVPCVFYGDEAGVQGFEDPLNRGTYPWGREDNELLEHYRMLGRLRTQYADLLVGEMHFVNDDDLIVFKRVADCGTFTVFANGGGQVAERNACGVDAFSGERVTSISVPPLGVRIIINRK